MGCGSDRAVRLAYINTLLLVKLGNRLIIPSLECQTRESGPSTADLSQGSRYTTALTSLVDGLNCEPGAKG